MTSRDDILGRVRGRLGHEDLQGRLTRIARVLETKRQGPRPQLEQDLAASFRRKAAALAAEVEDVATTADVPAAVARYLARHDLPLAANCWPMFERLPWREAGIALEPLAAQASSLVGVTGCLCALAETGTLVLCSGSETPAVTSLLPETHIAIVPCGRIVAGMEEAWQLLRRELPELPRAVNLVSGPSRTADIEQTMVLGAHGPYRVYIILVHNA